MDTCPQDSHMFVIFQEHFQKQRIENSMGSSEPTPKQVRVIFANALISLPTLTSWFIWQSHCHYGARYWQ